MVVHETGGPEVLRIEETDRPEPGEGEVLVRVRAASVNPVDWKFRRGVAEKQLPAVLGMDISGTVEISHADGFAEGDEVFGMAGSGGYAELATASAAVIAKKPDGITHEQAAEAAGLPGLDGLAGGVEQRRRCARGEAGRVDLLGASLGGERVGRARSEHEDEHGEADAPDHGGHSSTTRSRASQLGRAARGVASGA